HCHGLVPMVSKQIRVAASARLCRLMCGKSLTYRQAASPPWVYDPTALGHRPNKSRILCHRKGAAFPHIRRPQPQETALSNLCSYHWDKPVASEVDIRVSISITPTPTKAHCFLNSETRHRFIQKNRKPVAERRIQGKFQRPRCGLCV